MEVDVEVRRVAVGSRNPVKVQAVREVVAALFSPAPEVRGVEVESGVGDQPRSDEEALRGAEARARAALSATRADFAVGIESGVARVADGTFGFTWAVVCDPAGVLGRGCSARFEIPPAVARELERGAELDRAMQLVTGIEGLGRAEGAMGLVTGGHVTRHAAACQAIHFAFARFTAARLYTA